jgi:holo-[acyl-carrier protein] synthase
LIRTGVDIVEVERIERAIARYGERFFERIYTQQERVDARGHVASLAARFAAKEAVSKALGTGIGKVCWKDIEIIHGDRQQPILRLRGRANELASTLGLVNWSISISHTHTLAIAIAIAQDACGENGEAEERGEER